MQYSSKVQSVYTEECLFNSQKRNKWQTQTGTSNNYLPFLKTKNYIFFP